jgi:hypothetical protein
MAEQIGPEPRRNWCMTMRPAVLIMIMVLIAIDTVRCPVTATGQSASAPTAPAAPSIPEPADHTPDSPVDTIRELERQGPLRPGEAPLVSPHLRPKEKARQRLRKLEEQRERSKEVEQEQQTPQERAREKMQHLEQTVPADERKRLLKEEQERLRDLELHPLEKKPEPTSTVMRRPESLERVKYLLGVYENQVGIYDEILDVTKMGPGLLHRALDAPRWLILGGEQRTRYEGLNGSWRMNEPNGGQLLSMRTRLQVGIQNLVDPVRFLIEVQDSRGPLTTTGAYINPNNVNELDIQQLHMDLFSNNFLGTGIPTILKVGRVNMDLGRGRWVARNQFRNATNAFDGFEWQLGDERRWHIRSFLVQPVQRFVRKLDPWAPDEDSTFWGTYVESRMLPLVETTFHYFGHTSEGPGRDFNMLGGRIRKHPLPGEFDYEIESSYQFGNITPQTRSAHFQHGEVGYTFDMPWTPQALFKFDYASNGFDVLYGRRSFELHPTGIFGPFQRSNLASPGVRVMVKPIDRTYVFVQYRAWWLADDSSAWVGTGLQDPAGRSGNFVGNTFELRARWGLDDNVWLQAGYAHLSFGPFAEGAPGSPVSRDAHYGYFWTEFMF